jgi:hypothetical protein
MMPVGYEIEENVVVTALGEPWEYRGCGFGRLEQQDWRFRLGTRERKVQLPAARRKSGWQPVA